MVIFCLLLCQKHNKEVGIRGDQLMKNEDISYLLSGLNLHLPLFARSARNVC